MTRDTSTSLSPGFRFHPTDEELVSYYLRRKVSGKPFRFDPIAVIDIYKSEPWDLPGHSKLRSKDLEWYFFSSLDKKYGNGSRTNRATEKGYWKTTGKDRPVKHNSKIVGMKKTLVYHNGRAPRGTRSNWVMHEYKLVEDEALLNQGISPDEMMQGKKVRSVQGSFHPNDAFVLCRIFQKSGSGPKNGEQYGAPYVEEEWYEDDKEDQLDADDAVGNELVALDDSFLETNDLEKNLDICIISECGSKPFNFYHGESSNYEEYYLGSNGIDEKPVIGNVDTFEPGNDMFQLHAMEAKPVAGNRESFEPCYNQSAGVNLSEVDPAVETKSVAGNIETLEPHNVQSVGTNPHAMEANTPDDDCVGNAIKNLNPLSFNYSLDELYLVDTDDPVAHNSVVDESFLEANDLANPIKFENTAGVEILDEYFTCFDTDDDITQYINFDAFESSENPNPIESLPGDKQLMHDQTELLDVARKHAREADTDFEGSSSSQKAEEVKFGKGTEYPFLKQASQMLGSIHAPLAFASEFPTNDAALQFHNAAQASSSFHFTAGMIRIRNITSKGSGKGLTLGKNGDVDIILSSHLYCSNGSSAAVQLSGLLSVKTAFVLSHGWIFLMFFWVLILSVSCKIGSFLYTGQ